MSTRLTPPRFSIVMNVYNGAAYLRPAIDSVIAQSFADWELIVFDDASTDDSVAIAQSYDDPRIRILRADRNCGLGAARNRAIAEATGEWIAFLDQDDLWVPDKLALQDALIRDDRSGRLGIVYGRTRRFDSTGGFTPFDQWYGAQQLPEGDIFVALLSRPSFIALSSMALRRDAVLALGPVPARIRFCSDYFLSLMIARDHVAACVQSLCCDYRMHPSSMTRVYAREVHEEILYIIERAARPEDAAIVRRRHAVHHTWIAMNDFRRGDRRRAIGRLLRQGSIPYLLLRPLLARMRRLKDRQRHA